MIKNVFILLSFILVLMFTFSCNSDPEVVEPEDEPEDTQEPVLVERPENEYNQARGLRDIISKYQLNNYAQTDYDEAESSYGEAENNYEKDNTASKSAFSNAITKYNAVIQTGFPLLIEEKKEEEVDPVKESSEEIKANVASPDKYQAALDVYNQALAEKEAGNYEKSVELLEEAKVLFEEVYAEVVVKKDRAQNQLNALDQNIKDAQQRVTEDIQNSGQ